MPAYLKKNHIINSMKPKKIVLNKPKLISIIVPTRYRYDLLKKLLLSLENKTNNHNNIEVILIADSDDQKTSEVLSLINTLSYECYTIFRQKPKHFSLPVYYYNLGLSISEDSYFKWILGNDCEIITNNWDEKLTNFLQDNDNEVVNNISNNSKYYYVAISDNTHLDKEGKALEISPEKSNPCCAFPIISSNYIIDYNEFYSTELPSWNADFKLFNDFNQLKIINKAEILNFCNSIEVDHTCSHNSKIEKDQNYFNMQKTNDNLHNINRNIKEDIEKSKNKLAKKYNHNNYTWALKSIFALTNLIKENIKDNFVMAEIGCYDGSTTRSYIDFIKENNGHVHIVDWFFGNENVAVGPHEFKQTDSVYLDFCNKFQEYKEWMTIHKKDSHNGIQEIPDNSLDLCFIDADHRYDNVYKDIELSIPKMKKGGILCGHDHDLDRFSPDLIEDESWLHTDTVNGGHFGVMKAVYDFFGDSITIRSDIGGQGVNIWIKKF